MRMIEVPFQNFWKSLIRTIIRFIQRQLSGALGELIKKPNPDMLAFMKDLALEHEESKEELERLLTKWQKA